MQFPELIIKNAKIDYVPRVRCLGVILDHRLNWKKHCELLMDKALRSLTTIEPLLRAHFSLKGKMNPVQILHSARNDLRRGISSLNQICSVCKLSSIGHADSLEGMIGIRE